MNGRMVRLAGLSLGTLSAGVLISTLVGQAGVAQDCSNFWVNPQTGARECQDCSNFWVNPQTGAHECLDGLSSPSRSGPTLSRQELNNAALRTISQRSGRPVGDLEIANSTSVEATNVRDFKVIDLQGNLYGVALSASGQEVSPESLEAAILARASEPANKIHPTLASQLAQASSSQGIRSIVWFRGPETAPQRPTNQSERMSAEQLTTVQRQAASARAAAVAPFVQRGLSQVRGVGATRVSANQYDPVVYATLTPAQIRQLAQSPDVLEISEDSVNTPAGDIARQVVQAHVVHSRGITGSNVPVGVIEVGGRINTSNPFLSGVVQDTASVCSTADNHASGVVGIIRSRKTTAPSLLGMAYNSTVRVGGSCEGFDSQLFSRSTAAVNWGARALNLSFGGDSNRRLDGADRFYDSMIRTRRATVVAAAGNSGMENGNVGSPGLGYNVLTVGAFNDRNTVTTGDDVMAPYSSFRNPISTSNDRIKPEVVAPGTNIISTRNASPWTGNIGSGTSYAAPMVTGIAALLMQRNATFRSWPEATKAVIMATAVQNLEGAARLSDRDGAGGVNAERADNVARRVSGVGNWGAVSYTCAAPTTLTGTSPSFVARRRYRGVIVWSVDPNWSGYATRPNADLDLVIRQPNGTVVARSISYDNAYEIVDFVAPVSGTYRVQIIKHRCSSSPRYLGWAWHRVN